MEKEKSNSKSENFFGVIIWVIILIFVLSKCSGNDDNDVNINKYNTNIEIDYETVPLTTNAPINVVVDGETIYKHLEAGEAESLELSLDEGKHEIYLKNDGIYKTSKIYFKVDDEHTNFRFGAKTRLTVGVKFWMKDE